VQVRNGVSVAVPRVWYAAPARDVESCAGC
jgi:hypothetical protein